VLPVEVEKFEVFGPQPEVGARFTSRGSMLSTSYRHFVHSAEMIGPDGNMWCRLQAIKFWRLYLVFSKYSFHGPKDEHIISKQWKSVLRQSSAPACCMRLDIPVDQKQSMFRPVTAKITLSPSELRQFRELGGDEQKETDWLFGRLVAKDAVRVLWHARHQQRLFPADIIIEVDDNGRPTAAPRGATGPEPFPTVSFAKVQDVVAALAVFGPHAGIDLAYVRPRDAGFEGTAFDDEERTLLDSLGPNRDQWIIRLGCAKQAVARAIGCPPNQELNSFGVRYADLRTGTVKIVLGPTLAETYPEWRDAILIANTAHDGNLVVAVSFCERDGA